MWRYIPVGTWVARLHHSTNILGLNLIPRSFYVEFACGFSLVSTHNDVRPVQSLAQCKQYRWWMAAIKITCANAFYSFYLFFYPKTRFSIPFFFIAFHCLLCVVIYSLDEGGFTAGLLYYFKRGTLSTSWSLCWGRHHDLETDPGSLFPPISCPGAKQC